ncbi:MAG TPA: tetratricopeptide repeat-containing sensor histidine kinase [Rhodothermales bacterium]|nr:tetratricopeptide repeat-containing sensor histidine kinase [Rhodothermales bacterium]
MSDPITLIEQLRAKHADPRAFVDALVAAFEKLQPAQARGAGPLADEALRVSREIGYERGEALSLLAVGFVHYLWQRNREAFPLILEAKPRLDALEDEIIAHARCCTILTGLHTTMGNYQKALELGHEALEKVNSLEPNQWHAWSHYFLGDAYRALGELTRAREHYEKAYEFAALANLESGMARALIGLGGVCRDQRDFEASETYFNEARNRSEHRNDSITMARILSDLALVSQLKGDHDKSLALFEESLRTRRQQGGGLIAATCLVDLGKLLLEIERYDEAIERLAEALEISVEHDHKPRLYAAHEGLSEVYARKGDLDRALHHHKEYQRVKEEVMGADAATRLQNLEISLEVAAAQKEAEMIKAHIKELQAKNTELARLLKELEDAQEMLIQSEKMASLGQLTAGIAHEIKNPLNFVNNFSEMTKDLIEELSEAVMEHRDEPVRAIEGDVLKLASEITANADRILEHGRRAGQIVNSMLVHSRQSGGKKTEVDVNALVSTCVDLAYHGFVANNGGFEPVIERSLAGDAGTFTVIEDEVARVVTNVLNNALYAVHEHARTAGDGFQPRIRVQTSRRVGRIEVTIADNGAGIDDERKRKVFEPFYTTKPTGSGTGLGLSQSYEIVTKRHGGTLTVADTEGGGATFVVGIPAG